ncbi:MAG: DUF5659 domain-containing protein [Candidatus Pacearchaeota archaeon]
MSQKNKYYSTSDLALATVISLWYSLDAIDKQNPRKATFIFKRDEKLDKLLEAYWRRELKIEPQAYFNQLKAIKARLYSER